MNQHEPGGYAVPEVTVRAYYDELIATGPAFFTRPLPPPRALTIREQYRLRRAHLRDRLHDLLFPDCRESWE
jgi:hypothetical protein